MRGFLTVVAQRKEYRVNFWKHARAERSKLSSNGLTTDISFS